MSHDSRHQAWVFNSSHYNKDSDGEMDEQSQEIAWVFPDGLEVGLQVQYFKRHSSKSGYPRYGAVRYSESKTVAIGKVQSIQGNVAGFSWAGAASQRDDGAWSVDCEPAGQLTMEASQGRDYDQSGSRVGHSHYRNAQRQDSYCIRVPDAAWALLPRQTFVVTLTAHQAAEDDQLSVELMTLGGDRLDLKLAKDSTIEDLMRFVTEQRRLGPHALVNVLSADGVLLEQSLTVSTASCHGPPLSQIETAALKQNALPVNEQILTVNGVDLDEDDRQWRIYKGPESLTVNDVDLDEVD